MISKNRYMKSGYIRKPVKSRPVCAMKWSEYVKNPLRNRRPSGKKWSRSVSATPA